MVLVPGVGGARACQDFVSAHPDPGPGYLCMRGGIPIVIVLLFSFARTTRAPLPLAFILDFAVVISLRPSLPCSSLNSQPSQLAAPSRMFTQDPQVPAILARTELL